MLIIETRSRLWNENGSFSGRWSSEVQRVLNNMLGDFTDFSHCDLIHHVDGGAIASSNLTIRMDNLKLIIPLNLKNVKTSFGHTLYQAPEPYTVADFAYRLLTDHTAVSDEEKKVVMGERPFSCEAVMRT